jgi:hypothetical protein
MGCPMASDALKIAKLQARTELTSQVIALTTDPLWSTIAGFIAIHELRRANLIGPVADDVLYAGVIAINTARQPALMDLAGKGLSTAATVAVGASGAVAGTAVATRVVQAVKGVKTVKATQTVAELGKELAAGSTVKLAFAPGGTQTMSPAQLDKWVKKPAWKRFLGIG